MAEAALLERGTAGTSTSDDALRCSLTRAVGTVTRAVEVAQRERWPLLAKVVAEAALLVHAVEDSDAAATGAGARAASARLRGLLEAEVSGPGTAVRIALDPTRAVDLGAAYVLLTRGASGRPSGAGTPRRADVDQALRDACASPLDSERLPHRVLERCWLGRLVGLPGHVRAERAALALSALAHPADVLSGTRLDAYALTHTVMYATHLGTRRCPPVRPVHQVLADTRALLANALADDDLDLAGELLLVWPLLAVPLDGSARCALARLASAEAEHGTLPSRAHDPRDPERAAVSSYHAAVVWGVLLSRLLAREDGPRDWAPTARDLRVHRALARPSGPAGPPRAAGVAGAPVDARLAVSATLRAAVAARDVVTVQSVLELAEAHGLGDLAAARQSLDLLVRVGRVGRVGCSPTPA